MELLKKIIIAGEGKTFVMYAGIMLKRMGFAVIAAENGAEAVKLAHMLHPDLVLMELNMPVVDGTSALKQLKEDPQTWHIPVVITTADSGPGREAECKHLGAAVYLRRPAKLSVLHSAASDSMDFPRGRRRRHFRVDYVSKAAIIHNGKERELYTENISEGGIYIRKRDPLAMGTELNIRLRIGGGKTLNLRGVVRFVKGVFGDVFKLPPGMGIEFLGLSAEDTKALRDYAGMLIASDIIESQEEKILEMD